MPEILGHHRPPRLATAPSSPTLGEMYFDTASNRLLSWNGTAWIASVAHASTHDAGGSDPMAVDAAAAVGSLRTLGTGPNQAVAGNDSRLQNFQATSFTNQITNQNWPGAGNGVSFVAVGTKALIICHGTVYTVSGGTVVCDVLVNGVFMGNMVLFANNATNVRLNLTPLIFAMNVTPGTTYWVWYRLYAGNSDANDRGTVAVIQ